MVLVVADSRIQSLVITLDKVKYLLRQQPNARQAAAPLRLAVRLPLALQYPLPLDSTYVSGLSVCEISLANYCLRTVRLTVFINVHLSCGELIRELFANSSLK